MGQFNLENYVEVKDRIATFIADFPNGSIKSFIRHLEGDVVVVEARVFRTIEECIADVYTSGFSREIEGKGNVNKTSHLENCETSAIGRALANMGYGVDVNRASRSEMLKVARQNEEHDALLNFVREVFPKLTEDTEGVVEGDTVKLIEYLKGEGGAAMKDNYRLARSVVETLEAVTGIKYAA